MEDDKEEDGDVGSAKEDDVGVAEDDAATEVVGAEADDGEEGGVNVDGRASGVEGESSAGDDTSSGKEDDW